MKPTRWTSLLLPLCALALAGATCEKNAPTGDETPPAAPTAQPPAPPPAAPKGAALDVPGLDFSSLPPSAQKELANVFSDEFCYCGCPHTLGACLKEHSSCQHAKRMAVLAAGEAAAGAPSTEIIVLLSRYYLSFSEPRAQFDPDPRMCLGSPKAKVTLVEFSDFECPYCAAARPVLESFARENPDVRFCFAPFPLSQHPNAMPASQAVLFAREHGKFWELHDLLFENQTVLSRQKILELGAQVGLDKAALAKAIDQGTYQDEVRAFREAGIAAGLEATPTVFVNGRRLVLPISTESLRHTVGDELEWSSNGGAWNKD